MDDPNLLNQIQATEHYWSQSDMMVMVNMTILHRKAFLYESKYIWYCCRLIIQRLHSDGVSILE